MSKRAPDVSVLTANRLQDGIVVYLAADGGWVESIDQALVARSADEARALQAEGTRAVAGNLVVDAFLAEVAVHDGRPLPARMRERVRLDGPSVLADVPGYVSPSPRATPTSHCAPTARGEGRGEGQGQAPSSPLDPAPHPNPLPANGERGSRAGGA